MIPITGVYPIAMANDRDQISAPLMSRFAVIEIPDYTPEEKKIIFTKYSLPKVMKRIGMRREEYVLTDEALDAVADLYSGMSGIGDQIYRMKTDLVPAAGKVIRYRQPGLSWLYSTSSNLGIEITSPPFIAD